MSVGSILSLIAFARTNTIYYMQELILVYMLINNMIFVCLCVCVCKCVERGNDEAQQINASVKGVRVGA